MDGLDGGGARTSRFAMSQSSEKRPTRRGGIGWLIAAANRPGAIACSTPVKAGQVSESHAPSGLAMRAATTNLPMPATFQSSVRRRRAERPSARPAHRSRPDTVNSFLRASAATHGPSNSVSVCGRWPSSTSRTRALRRVVRVRSGNPPLRHTPGFQAAPLRLASRTQTQNRRRTHRRLLGASAMACATNANPTGADWPH